MLLRVLGILLVVCLILSCTAQTVSREPTTLRVPTDREYTSFVLPTQSIEPFIIKTHELTRRPRFIRKQNKPTIKHKQVAVRVQPVYHVPTVTSAQKFAKSKIGAAQYACLYQLWKRESNWNPRAFNRSSGAYGIPQALPGRKMRSAGSDWKTNPITQVKWGLRYIGSRYGSACSAWKFWLNHHWY